MWLLAVLLSVLLSGLLLSVLLSVLLYGVDFPSFLSLIRLLVLGYLFCLGLISLYLGEVVLGGCGCGWFLTNS